MWSAPLWPTRLSAGTSGTSRSGGCRPTGRARWIERRPAARARPPGAAVDRPEAVLQPVERGLLHPRAALARRSPAPRRRDTSPAGRHGSIRAAKQPSTFHRFPIPAIVRWSSSASPIGRVGSSSRSRRRKRASSSSGARMSGPEAGDPLVEARARLGHQLEHRPVELHDLARRRAQDRSQARRGERGQRAPASSTRQDPVMRRCEWIVEAALEAQEQVLAVGVDARAPRARQALGPAVARRSAGAACASSSGTWPASTGRMRLAA